MKQFMSVILAVVLVASVGGSLVSGTMAGFFDVEQSTDNYMCAGTRCLEVSGGPIVVEHAWPASGTKRSIYLLTPGAWTARLISISRRWMTHRECGRG